MQVASEFRAKEQVESAFLKATSPAKPAPILDIPQSTSIMAQLVINSTVSNSSKRSESTTLAEPSPLACSVSPEPIGESTSIAALKARLAALQVSFLMLLLAASKSLAQQAARVSAAAKLSSSLSSSPAPNEDGPSAPSLSSAMIARATDSHLSSSPRSATFEIHASVDVPLHFSAASPDIALGQELYASNFPAGAVEDASTDHSFHAPAQALTASLSLDGNSDADADASTVIIKEDDSSMSNSGSGDGDGLGDSSSTSIGYSSDINDDSTSVDEDHTALGRDHVPSDANAPNHIQSSSIPEMSEVSDFMGTAPGTSNRDLFHASPPQWLACLSAALPIKVARSESQSGDERHHAVNIVNVRLGILQPVAAHYDIACSAILSMMRREWCLDAYTQTLQHFHLMEDGAFGDSFANALFDAMDEMPIQRMLPDQFDQLLAHALKSSQSDSHPFAHKLRLKYASFSGQSDQVETTSDGLDRLQLVLDISDEPAAIVLTKETMYCYQSVFVLLLRLRRIIRVASRLFWDIPKDRSGFRDPQSLEYTKTSVQQLASLRELTLFRHEISHFAHTLQSYLMTQILHISVPELAAQQKGVRDLQQLITVHTSFIEVCDFASTSRIV